MEHKITAEHSGRKCTCGIHIPAHQTGKHPCEVSSEEISRYLTEKVLGLAYQDWIAYDTYGDNLTDHFTPLGIFALIEAGRKKDWWEEFEWNKLIVDDGESHYIFIINYDNLFDLPNVLYTFLKEREKNE